MACVGVRVGVAGVGGGGGAWGGGDSRPTPWVVGVMVDGIYAVHQPNGQKEQGRGGGNEGCVWCVRGEEGGMKGVCGVLKNRGGGNEG